MKTKNSEVDNYFRDGCGRCAYFNTPDCKVNIWRKELKQLRQLLQGTGLIEALKWKQPCYTFENKNILLLSAFKEYCALSFFKGALLKDPDGILVSPGENSQSTRQIRVTDVKTIKKLEPTIKAYIDEAINIEKAGLKVTFKKTQEPTPDELQSKFKENPAFKQVFESLTPGRQRAYILFISAAKQAKTRMARIEKYYSKIMEGKGIND